MKEKYIKSPLNYTGGKYKLLPQIMPILQKNIRYFVDLFGGGFNVGINIECELTIYNDIENHVVELMKYLSNKNIDFLHEIEDLIAKYNLSKENTEGFNKLREYYNEENNNPIVLYTLICYAFNYQIRFNRDGKYNMPFGKNRSSFNPSLRQNFICFIEALHKKNCAFYNFSFDKFDFDNLRSNDLVYCDPPYLNSFAVYNERRVHSWTKNDEKKLLDILDFLDKKHIRFALSNNLKYDNPLLNEWKDKYNVHYLNGDYRNCNYHKINRDNDIEVLITNY